MTGTIWDQVLGRIETKVNRYTCFAWFRSTTLAADNGGTLTVRVGDRMVVDWLTKHYAGVIREALAEVGRADVRLEFVTDNPEAALAATAPEQDAALENEDLGDDGVGLSPRYSFDTFIVGSSNQFAHAACRAVAEAPSRSYNPLFLYGGVGRGKTHLMHAIGHYVLRHSQGLKLTYVWGERFMNEVVNAIRYDHILEFRERYRGVDVLLVDDVQFIVGKERTQIEFF